MRSIDCVVHVVVGRQVGPLHTKNKEGGAMEMCIPLH